MHPGSSRVENVSRSPRKARAQGFERLGEPAQGKRIVIETTQADLVWAELPKKSIF